MSRGEASISAPFGPIGSDSSDRGAAGRPAAGAVLRADLHAHSRYSKPCGLGGARALGGIGDPEAIDRAARARGMDLVTLTDRDTIDGCLEFLDRHPAARHFFVSEEVTARDPRTGGSLSVLLYDIDEEQHREARRLRADVRELAGYVRAEGIAASLGPFAGVMPVEALPSADVRRILDLFDRFELVHGARSRAHNLMVARLAHEAAAGRRFGITAGSGAHGPARVGRTATLAFAGCREEFLAELRRGRTWAAGAEGSRWAATLDLLRLLRHDGRSSEAGTALVLGHLLRGIRLDAGIRAARRRLDRTDVQRFRRRAKAFVAAASAARSNSRGEGRPAVASVPHDRSQRWA